MLAEIVPLRAMSAKIFLRSVVFSCIRKLSDVHVGGPFGKGTKKAKSGSAKRPPIVMPGQQAADQRNFTALGGLFVSRSAPAQMERTMGKASVRKSNGQHPAPVTDTSEPTAQIAWNDAVDEGKRILAKIDEAERSQLEAERGQLGLGELADKVQPKYGQQTLAKFAEVLGVKASKLEGCRRVWRKWDGDGKPPRGRFVSRCSRSLRTSRIASNSSRQSQT